jgi:hypothetical protein
MRPQFSASGQPARIDRKREVCAMLHWWLIPLLLALVVVLLAFYGVIKRQGGSGTRTDGRTLVDKPDEDSPPLE